MAQEFAPRIRHGLHHLINGLDPLRFRNVAKALEFLGCPDCLADLRLAFLLAGFKGAPGPGRFQFSDAV